MGAAAGSGGTAPPSEVLGSIHDDALENLVRQFARPLDCLRELVQNSIDAGSPRVEVRLAWTPPTPPVSPSAPGHKSPQPTVSQRDLTPSGVLAITVEDFGSGMDEHIIDEELTRMFASSKAGDLSKIGRFGIGFTSVFAIAPDLVHLRTGRHGEGWELVFHPDRSFDKIRIDTPVQGTRIVLYKRLPASELPRWTRDIRSSLTFWCEHCAIPVLFDDGKDALVSASPSDCADPFAAFEEVFEPSAEAIQRPLDLPDAQWAVKHDSDGILVWAGLGDSPHFGWYNGGLTLLSTPDSSCLGSDADRFGHLRLKVQHDRLEHTLTRDNVIQDREWERAMVVVREAVTLLAEHIVAAHEAAVAGGEPLEDTLDAVARWLQSADQLPPARQLRTRLHLPQVSGPPSPLPSAGALSELMGGTGRWMVAASVNALTEALLKRDWMIFEDSPPVRILLDHLFGEGSQGCLDWVLVEAVPVDGDHQHLLDAIGALLRKAGARRPEVALCHVVSNDADPALVPLVVHRAPSAEPVTREGLGPGLWHRIWGSPPTIWVNIAHPNVGLAAEAARIAPDVGAYALLQAIFVTEPAVGGHSGSWRAVKAVVSR